ncbi:MAG: acetyl-CoA carboxylase biotin carboxyl carrier protein subunit, partial [Gammaproteobacteria bacterium]|nr:acetyl-CoA carboxylase biotin carboxyl carrier protein subunit [Gammaproteobacteria bacterium]
MKKALKSDSKQKDESDVKYDSIQVVTGGHHYQTLLTKKFISRKPWIKPDLQEIYSIIPGTVTTIIVKVGDKVEKGKEIMIYEAMKMQNIILAPFSGVIEKILVKEGDKLPKGALMI